MHLIDLNYLSSLKALKSIISISFFFVLIIVVFRVTYTKDTKVPNAGSFTVQKEDHTMGNIIRMYVPNIILPHSLC